MPESASRQRARSDRAAGAGPAPRLPPARFARPSPTRVAPAPKVGDSSPRPSHRSPCPLAVRRGHHANHRSPPERSRTEVLFDDLAVVPTCDRAKVDLELLARRRDGLSGGHHQRPLHGADEPGDRARPTRRARSASYTACCRCDCRGRSCSPPHKISWNCPGASLLPSPLQNTKPPPCRIARSAAASSGVRSTQRCRLLFGAFSSPSHFGADLLAAKHLISKPLRPRSGRWAVSLGRQRSINFRPPTPRASH